MEEALRQQAINRLQRRQNQAVADESSGDVEQAGTSSSLASENTPAAVIPAPEMELVFKPHPKQLATDNAIASETRYIKTTANATGTSEFWNYAESSYLCQGGYVCLFYLLATSRKYYWSELTWNFTRDVSK